jgi:hypothetical protein
MAAAQQERDQAAADEAGAAGNENMTLLRHSLPAPITAAIDGPGRGDDSQRPAAAPARLASTKAPELMTLM